MEVFLESYLIFSLYAQQIQEKLGSKTFKYVSMKFRLALIELI